LGKEMTEWMSEYERRWLAMGQRKQGKQMGPIERELRSGSPNYLRPEIWRVLNDASKSLGIEWVWLESSDFDGDVESEAIEAAEALGL
jgi:hypothetical protein